MSPPYSTLPITPLITPLPSTSYGAAFQNTTQSNFSILLLPKNAMSVYTWTTMGSYAIPTFLVLFFLYIGLWFSGGNVRIPSIIGLLFGGSFMFASGGLGLSIPVEMVAVGYGALVASLCGIIMSIFKST